MAEPHSSVGARQNGGPEARQAAQAGRAMNSSFASFFDRACANSGVGAVCASRFTLFYRRPGPNSALRSGAPASFCFLRRCRDAPPEILCDQRRGVGCTTGCFMQSFPMRLLVPFRSKSGQGRRGSARQECSTHCCVLTTRLRPGEEAPSHRPWTPASNNLGGGMLQFKHTCAGGKSAAEHGRDAPCRRSVPRSWRSCRRL